MNMDLSAIIVAIITFLTGILGTLATLKYTRKSAKHKAEQEEKTSEALTLKNTNEIIELYKTALKDMESINEKHEAELKQKLDEQNTKIQQQNEKLQQYEITLKKQSDLIDKLSSTQGVLKLEIERLKKLSMGDCNECEFRSGCAKYKAKQLLEKSIHIESIDAENKE